MQQKMAAGEPGGGDDQERIADYRWSAAVAPGVLYRLPWPAAIAAAGAKHLTMKLMPHLRFSRMPGGGFSAGTGGGETFEGEFQRKDEQRDRLDHKDDRRDYIPGPVSRCDRAALQAYTLPVASLRW